MSVTEQGAQILPPAVQLGLWRFYTVTLSTACLRGQTSNSGELPQLLCSNTSPRQRIQVSHPFPRWWLSFHVNFKRNWGRLQVKFWKKKTVLNCKLRKKALHFF